MNYRYQSNLTSFNRHQPTVSVVVPCFNEEAVMPTTAKSLADILVKLKQKNEIEQGSFIYFVDDGSKDQTWATIHQLHRQDPIVKGLKLSRNVGHQNALLAGLLSVKDRSDCIISIDADLQQDVAVIPEFIQKFKDGAEIVYGIRQNRQTDSIFKRLSALSFYRLMKIMGAQVVKNHADFRLMSKTAVEALSLYRETNLFLRGVVTDLGFPTDTVYFTVKDRLAGRSKYGLRKMTSFALNGITSFSVVPLRLVAMIGLLVFLFSVVMGGYVLIEALVAHKTVPGWASTVLPIYIIGGIQILSLGVVGEYIGKIYKEVKDRPRFIKEQEIE